MYDGPWSLSFVLSLGVAGCGGVVGLGWVAKYKNLSLEKFLCLSAKLLVEINVHSAIHMVFVDIQKTKTLHLETLL